MWILLYCYAHSLKYIYPFLFGINSACENKDEIPSLGYAVNAFLKDSLLIIKYNLWNNK